MNTKVFQFGYCYVTPQTDREIHPIFFFKSDLILYPERGKSLYKMVRYRPFVNSVITENPYVVSCYDKTKVKIWDEIEGWISPEDQTLGCSTDAILNNLLGVHATIPAALYDGGDEIEEQIEKLEKIYKKALDYNFELISNNENKTYS